MNDPIALILSASMIAWAIFYHGWFTSGEGFQRIPAYQELALVLTSVATIIYGLFLFVVKVMV